MTWMIWNPAGHKDHGIPPRLRQNAPDALSGQVAFPLHWQLKSFLRFALSSPDSWETFLTMLGKLVTPFLILTFWTTLTTAF